MAYNTTLVVGEILIGVEYDEATIEKDRVRC